jgi:RimJ/RimL family protein N-acetyltransferase
MRPPDDQSAIRVNDSTYLSEFRAADEAACVEYLNEREIYDRTLRIPYPYTAADFQAWLKTVEQTTGQQGRPVQWAIRNDRDLLIGACGFDRLQIGKSHRAEIGYWLAKPYWGRGIMTSVVNRLCEVAFAEFGLAKIFAHVFSYNPASARVLAKCGFEQEGFLKKHCIKDGRFIDTLLLARLKP